eukprot:SAG11_NODE_55_length_19449_cov_28.630135_13_plen_103_part_00
MGIYTKIFSMGENLMVSFVLKSKFSASNPSKKRFRVSETLLKTAYTRKLQKCSKQANFHNEERVQICEFPRWGKNLMVNFVSSFLADVADRSVRQPARNAPF